MTHSLNVGEPIHATPISFCIPTNYDIDRDDGVKNPKNENETPPTTTQNSKSKRGRPFKSPPESIKNWYVIRKERKIGKRFDTTYIHKETRFRCRSLKEVKNYEKYGSLPRRHKVKTQDKEESDNKTKNETEEMIVAQRKAKAEVMRTFVEEFLSEAHHNQLHMFNP
ncbi:hypothetical protein JHK87_023011 [Glycine soja]|nr:hypothetical protein JHK87_023011 [Glycine soja]